MTTPASSRSSPSGADSVPAEIEELQCISICCFIPYLNNNIITLTSLILLNTFEVIVRHPPESHLLLLLLVLRIGHVLLGCGSLTGLRELVTISAIRQIQWTRPHLLLKQVGVALRIGAYS
jgi:hypothetical protein